MSQRARKKKPERDAAASLGWPWTVGAPLLLAAVAFFAYWPSLSSGFVYDARIEVFEEGFFTNLANLPTVLSLKVLSMPLILGDRPGQLLYLMLNFAAWGLNPWGYHLCSNLLHAANTGLLFVLALRLSAPNLTGLTARKVRMACVALAVTVLVFALHPIAVEPVSAINFSSDLLITFFTLLALLAATAFRPDNSRTAWIAGVIGTLCAFAAVTCKESGAAAALLIAVYWFLFRRAETKMPWLFFIGAAFAAMAAFMVARFALAPPGLPKIPYLGGSLGQVFWIQPRLWVFMIGKLLWPVNLSADYTLENADGISTPVAFLVLSILVAGQIWLARQSRVAALGVAMFWLGLATVSNFMPLYRVVADRFYYLPMAGVALQVVGLLVLLLKWRTAAGSATAALAILLVPLTWLTLDRQAVYADDFPLWTDTARVSPFSWTAQNELGAAYSRKGNLDDAVVHYRRALELNPYYPEAHNNLGIALRQQNQFDAAIAEYQTAIANRPTYAEAYYNLGNALFLKDRFDEAIAQYRAALALKPGMVLAHYNLGNALQQEKKYDDAISEYHVALAINPRLTLAHYNLGNALVHQGDLDGAIAEYQAALAIEPTLSIAQENLTYALAQKQRAQNATASPH